MSQLVISKVREVDTLGYQGKDKPVWDTLIERDVVLSSELSRKLLKQDSDSESYIHIAPDVETLLISELLAGLKIEDAYSDYFFVEDACEGTFFMTLDRDIDDLSMLIECEIA